MIMSAVNIAVANHYFDEHPNNNINTAQAGALCEYLWGKSWLGQYKSNVIDIVNSLVRHRRVPKNGFPTMEAARDALNHDESLPTFRKMAEIKAEVLNHLTLGYRPADVLWG